MTYASLMVYVDEGPEAEARVKLACDLAVRFDARLIGISASYPDAPQVDPYAGGAMLGEMLGLFRDAAEADVKRTETLFWAAVGSHADRCEWRGRLGFPADVVGQDIRAADLLILGRLSPERGTHRSLDPGDAIMALGRPVLIVPPQPARSPLGTAAVVAWKDCREAQRAVASALPMLRAATLTHVIEICGSEATEEARGRTHDVAAYLERHGITASPRVLHGDGGPRARQIQTFAEDQHAGLVVAGGYGHARMREWVLGGVTHGLLGMSSVCLLLSH
ncbi:universal stress protein [Brevundimonas variabilis]|uniref:Nucleotide-binding universal stress UspA family protein n=1 Tax=Brevundimonas variabilis TaxID=74312 RepID=A0A7W9CJS8_9CAUL|nr:universal stress protein [Brevundimonas variabilis]MBB5746703.1 nucleotide-binding universal stress UspA family protein [Brevundimonas variabilis]